MKVVSILFILLCAWQARGQVEEVFVRVSNETPYWDGVKYLPRELNCLLTYTIQEKYSLSHNTQRLYTVVSFTAAIEIDKQVIYKEEIKGNCFTKTFNDAWDKNSRRGYLRIKKVTIQEIASGKTFTKVDAYSNVWSGHQW